MSGVEQIESAEEVLALASCLKGEHWKWTFKPDETGFYVTYIAWDDVCFEMESQLMTSEFWERVGPGPGEKECT